MQNKDSVKKYVKDTKIFLKNKKMKGEKRSEVDIKVFLTKKNKSYMRLHGF